VIILVYDVNNLDIIKRLRSYWLPKIEKVNEKVPVIKLDLRSYTTEDGELESLLTPNFMEYKQVEMGIECSAKGYIGLIDIISCA
jgi:GTPase SAR1 family protein